MQHPQAVDNYDNRLNVRLSNFDFNVPRKTVVGIILVVALFAFEIFNFDTTRYALRSLLGDVNFLGLQWAGILAIAFCSIDFAGLVRIFTPEKGRDEPKEVWYLMGAWLLGATMNAVMTWWAVSLTLLSHDFGNEVLSREQLLKSVPIFVAVLVWLTRILFIGAFSVAGEHIFDMSQAESSRSSRSRGQHEPVPPPAAARPAPVRANGRSRSKPNNRQYTARPTRLASRRQPANNVAEDDATFLEENQTVITNGNGRSSHKPRRNGKTNSRIKQRPPRPGGRQTGSSRKNRVQARPGRK